MLIAKGASEAIDLSFPIKDVYQEIVFENQTNKYAIQ
jgi:hypothetical protein